MFDANDYLLAHVTTLGMTDRVIKVRFRNQGGLVHIHAVTRDAGFDAEHFLNLFMNRSKTIVDYSIPPELGNFFVQQNIEAFFTGMRGPEDQYSVCITGYLAAFDFRHRPAEFKANPVECCLALYGKKANSFGHISNTTISGERKPLKQIQDIASSGFLSVEQESIFVMNDAHGGDQASLHSDKRRGNP